MSDNTPLDVRMKGYEHAFRQTIPPRSYTLMRLDGRAFHSYLRHADKPFDTVFMEQMDLVAKLLCEEMMGVRLAYVQSDEISLLLTDFERPQSEQWFGGNMNKLLSIPAALASGYLARLRIHQDDLPQFDCRVWAMADQVEVANYFLWRQRDAVRNSIQMVAQYYYSPRALNGRSTDELQEILFREQGINWNDFNPRCKRGRLVMRSEDGWAVQEAPMFKAEPGNVLAELIPALPSLRL